MGDAPCKHRHNADNSWDSICPHCFLIIARVELEAQLAPLELQHICDPALLRKPAPLNFRVFFGR